LGSPASEKRTEKDCAWRDVKSDRAPKSGVPFHHMIDFPQAGEQLSCTGIFADARHAQRRD
jgi:hypothetical protein